MVVYLQHNQQNKYIAKNPQKIEKNTQIRPFKLSGILE